MPELSASRKSLFHEGEVALQAHLGVADLVAAQGARVIRDQMPEQHRVFFAHLPFIVMGAVNPSGRPWATLRAGAPGFLKSPDPQTLVVHGPRDRNDPADAGLNDGDAIGLLGIELPTRRRNRMNGHIQRTDSDLFQIHVAESFGNCPQYIQQRDVNWQAGDGPNTSERTVYQRLDGPLAEMVRAADTFFIGSFVDGTDQQRRVDVSHRGGRPGFVRIDPDGSLLVPDFSGNQHFSTLGNLLVNPKAGLVFADFATGSLLQMTGSTEILLDERLVAHFEGAERAWRFHPQEIVWRPNALPLRGTLRPDGWSLKTLATGQWA
jgi:uncharacterized protein